jgi:hypothetical protein
MSAAIAMGVLSVGALVELALAEAIRSRVARRRASGRVTGMVEVSGRAR